MNPASPTRNRHTSPRVPHVPEQPAQLLARPEPVGAKLPDHATAEALLIAAQRTQHTVGQALDELVVLLRRMQRPAGLRQVRLTATSPKAKETNVGDLTAQSIGIYNPNPIVIYTSVDGSIAEPGRGALTIPASCAVVLPVAVTGPLELGAAAADLAAGDAVVWTLRFETAQPLTLGAL